MLSDIQKFAMDNLFIEEEGRRIDPYAFEADQQYQVKQDVKAWAVENDHRPETIYSNMIALHAFDRGWTQEGFTGLEMPHDD